MFFDEENCSALRVLREISGFLEASIEKLLVLEKETLEQLEKEKSQKREQSLSPVEVKEEPVDEVALVEDIETNKTKQYVEDTLLSSVPSETGAAINLRSDFLKTSENSKLKLQQGSHFLNDASPVKRKLDSDLLNQDKNKIRKSVNNLSESVPIKKEFVDSFVDCGFNISPSTPTSTDALDLMNDSYSQRLPSNTVASTIHVKKELLSPKKANNDCNFTTGSEEIHGHDENSVYGPPRVVSEIGYIIREHEFFKARIKFKKCFNFDEVHGILTKAGVKDIEDIALVQKNAIVAFLSELNLKVLLDLNNQCGLKKIKALSVEPYKKYTVIEEKVKPVQKKRKGECRI